VALPRRESSPPFGRGGVVRNVDGVAGPRSRSTIPGVSPGRVDGDPFDDVVDRVCEILGES